MTATQIVVENLILAIVCFVLGAGVYRNNAKQAETDLAAANAELAKLKAAGQAVGSAIKSA